MRSTLRYKPIYKYFQKLRENIYNNEKLLKFKKKKWSNLVKRLTLAKPYLFFNHNVRQISRNAKPLKNLYRSQLATKKRLNIYYGKFTNNQLKKLSRESFYKSKLKSCKKSNSELFLNSLESRLSTVLFRAHFVPSINTARQLITYGNVYVNNKKIYSCNFLLKSGDLIQISKKFHPVIKNNILKSKMWPLIPLHLEVNFKILSIYFVNNADIFSLSGHFPFWLNIKNIVSFYKK
jgi:small subunit ribosomal protein S4